MQLPTVSPDELRAGQFLTLVTFTILLGGGLIPRYGTQIRMAALGLYLLGIAGFVIHFLTR
jgi:hypothetical protein